MTDKFANIHPDLMAAARKSPAFTFSGKILWLVRLAMRLMPSPAIPKDVRIRNVHVPGGGGHPKMRLRLYRPAAAAAPAPALLWIHGGGYVIGRPEMDDFGCAHFASELGITVVSVDYRLAPDHPFPAGLDDCYAALRWVQSQAVTLGIDVERIAIGGASAGGGLAAALVQLAHDRKEIKPFFQLLIYPMIDDRVALSTVSGETDHVGWNRINNRYGWMSYLGREYGSADMPAYAAPARRTDLSGLPPAWIGVGSEDLFKDEDVAYAQALQACGVACELVIVPGAFHGFDMLAAGAGVSQDFRAAQMAALKKQLFPAD